MYRALLIPLAQCELPSWSLPRFQVECASDERDGIRRLQAQPIDVVVVVARGSSRGAAEACARLEAACGGDVVPLLLAAHGEDAGASEVLEAHPLDGFVDLAWGPQLVARCLGAAIQRVRAGRGVAEIQSQVLAAVREQMAQLQEQSLRDELTGLYNPRAFHEMLEREHARSRRSGRGYALVRFELENFRELNAHHGPSVGARALSRVGVALSSTLRPSDDAFRLGEAAFACLLPESDPGTARLYAERICGTLRQCVLTAGEARAHLVVTAGICVGGQDGAPAGAVLSRAEEALQRARGGGSGRSITVWSTAA